MNYDQNPNPYGYQDADQDELWLEDLKSLLDEDPGTAPSPGSIPVHTPAPQAVPQHRQMPRQDPYGYQQPVQQNFNFQPDFSRPVQPMNYVPESELNQPHEGRRKQSHTAVIVLSVIIVLEILAISAVLMHWIHWMG